MQDKVRQLISEDAIEEALELLETLNNDEVILLKGQYASLQRQNNNGILKQDEYDIKLNRIKAAALSLAKKLPKDSPAINPTPTTMPTSSANQADGIQRQLELLIGRQNALREAIALTFDPNQKFAYNHQIEQLEGEIAALRQQLPAGSASSGQSTSSGHSTSIGGATSTNQPAIYFSYAWGDSEEAAESREAIVDQLYGSLLNDGFVLKRDKMDLDYKGFISEFMQEIGRSGLVVVAISDKYLRSPYCMHELHEIYRNSRQEKEEFSKRVFPIRVESIKMSDPFVIEEYLAYWEEQETKWKNLVQKRASQLSPAHFNEFDKVREINSKFSELLAFLQDMNSMSKKLLAQDDFAIVKDAVRARMQELG
ncbi:MAG: toll/interleukin-1 receptor domain-containing protein [Saprospiraceae bacterium]|nr:toll/interleukin-1 receptor domain-containing protein [Saprospiraceae bacterium]